MKLSTGKARISAANDVAYINFCAKALVVFFKLFGLAPLTVVQTVQPRKISKNASKTSKSIKFAYSVSGCFYNVFLIVFLIGMNCLAIPYVYDNDYPNKSNLTVTFELISAILGTATVLVMWILYCMKQRTIVNLLNRLLTIDRTLVGLHGGSATASNRYYFFCLFLGNWLVWIAVVISSNQCYDLPIISIFNNLVPAMIVNCLMIQYVVMNKFIEIRFINLNRALFENVGSSIDHPIRSSFILESVTSENHNLPEIIEYRRAHFLLYEIAGDFANFYSLPITFAITIGCIVIIYNCYYSVIMFLLNTDGNRLLVMFNSLTWIATMILPITLLAVGVDRIADQIKQTADVIHKLLTKTITNREDKSQFLSFLLQLEEFSLELVQRNVTFDACGLFTLDCTLVHSIFSMVAMYLVILLQFQLAN